MSPRPQPCRITARFSPRAAPVQYRRLRKERRTAPEPEPARSLEHGPTVADYLTQMSDAEWELWHGLDGPVSPRVAAMVARAMARESMVRRPEDVRWDAA